MVPRGLKAVRRLPNMKTGLNSGSDSTWAKVESEQALPEQCLGSWEFHQYMLQAGKWNLMQAVRNRMLFPSVTILVQRSRLTWRHLLQQKVILATENIGSKVQLLPLRKKFATFFTAPRDSQMKPPVSRNKWNRLEPALALRRAGSTQLMSASLTYNILICTTHWEQSVWEQLHSHPLNCTEVCLGMHHLG